MKSLAMLSLGLLLGGTIANGIPLQEQPKGKGNFTLLIYETEADVARRADSQTGPAYWADYGKSAGAMKSAGVLLGGSPLEWGDRLTTITQRQGIWKMTTEAPTKTSLHLGGFFNIKAETREAAIEWAKTIPAVRTGAVVVCPEYAAPAMTPEAR